MAFTISVQLSAQDNGVAQKFEAVNAQLRAMQKASRDAGDGAAASAHGFAEMSASVQGAMGAIQGVIALAAGNQLVQWGMELVEVGSQVNAVGATFEQLAGGEAAAAAALDMLRSSTRGVVDDLTLMEGANRLLMMGLAQSAEEAASLSQIAVTLGGAMGMDAAGSIENFGAAIANMSYERLDQLGISAGRVRDRVRELKEEGYATEDAFRMAVLEQGAAAMERLGSAASVSATGIAQLQTRWTNAMQAMGTATFAWVNDAANTVGTIITGLETIQTFRMGSPDNLAIGGYVTGLAPIQSLADAAPIGTVEIIPTVNTEALDFSLIQATAAAGAEGFSVDLTTAYSNMLNDQINALLDAPNIGAGAMLGDIQLFTPEAAETLQREADNMQTILDRAKELHDQELISDVQLEGISQTADEAERLADAAARGAEAFENMTLTQAFGQGGGGMAGEMSTDVLESMRAGGATDEELAAMQDTLDLASGRATDASIAYRDEVVPLLTEIGQQLGPEAVAEAITNLEASLQEAAFQGLDADTIAENMAIMTGFEETPEGLQAVMDFDAATLVTDLGTASGSGSLLSADMAIAAREASTLADALNNLPTEHRMVLNVSAMLTGDLPPEVLAAIVGGAITNAGGVAPAADPRNQPAPVNGGFSPTSYP